MKKFLVIFSFLFFTPVLSYAALPNSFGINSSATLDGVLNSYSNLGNGWDGTSPFLKISFNQNNCNLDFQLARTTSSNYSNLVTVMSSTPGILPGGSYTSYQIFGSYTFDPSYYYRMNWLNCGDISRSASLIGDTGFASSHFPQSAPTSSFTPYMDWGQASISFTNLVSTSTPYADFQNWEVTIDPGSLTASTSQIWVQYTKTPGTLDGDTYDTSGQFPFDFPSSYPDDFLFNKSLLLFPLPSNVTSTHWYARAYYFLDNVLVAQSQVVDFYVNQAVDYTNPASGTVPVFPFTQQPLSSSTPSSSQPWYYYLIGGRTIDVIKDGQVVTSSLSFIQCDDTWTVKSAVCGIVYVLLDPSWTGTPNFVQNSSQKLSTQFPFSIIGSIIGNIAYQSENYDYSSSTLILDMSSTSPAFGPGDSITLLSSSSLSNLIGESRKQELFQVEKYLMWFFILVILFMELRKLKFF